MKRTKYHREWGRKRRRLGKQRRKRTGRPRGREPKHAVITVGGIVRVYQFGKPLPEGATFITSKTVAISRKAARAIRRLLGGHRTVD